MKKPEIKKTLINFEASPAYRKRLKAAAKILDMPYRKLITQAIDEKLERAARRNDSLRAELDKGVGANG